MHTETDENSILYQGTSGPGLGKTIVLVSGDEEYRSEEALPILARVLAEHHGFTCRVLFAINRETGEVDPATNDNLPGLHHLAEADLMLLFIRFRQLPDDQAKRIMEHTQAGKPIVAIRTATHAFRYAEESGSPFAAYSFRSPDPEGGYGKFFLGETWAGHHGKHGYESTRGVMNAEAKDHPILRGFEPFWCPTDVYKVNALPEDATVLVWGEVLVGMNREDSPHPEKNNPRMPLIWVRERDGKAPIVTSTAGAAIDLVDPGLRRVLVNACYYSLGLGERIPACSEVGANPVNPSYFKMGGFKRGLKPADFLA